ncbi:MAG: MFS transporter, partial [Acidobacteria bacterium]
MGAFTLIWTGQVISLLGSGVVAFTLGVVIFRASGSVTRFAMLQLASALPFLLLSPLAGRLADRFDRRLILILAQLGGGAVNLVLYRLVADGDLTWWHAYPVVATSSAFAAFTVPTLGAATTMLVAKEHLARASGMLQMGASLARIVAPFLGGMLLDVVSLPGIVVLNFASYLIAASTLVLVRIPPPTPEQRPASRPAPAAAEPAGREASAWRFIRRRPGLFYLLLLFAALNFTIGMVQVLLAPMILSFAPPRTLGLVMSVAWSGTLIGGMVMTVWGGPQRRVPLILGVMALQGALLMLGGLAPSAPLIAGAAFFFLLGMPFQIASTQAIWQRKTPPAMQGRVFAVRVMIGGSSIPLAQALAGPLADEIFEPLMDEGGALADSVGRLIGAGDGRGIALIYLLAGLFVLLLAVAAGRLRALRRLEEEIPDAVAGGEGGRR